MTRAPLCSMTFAALLIAFGAIADTITLEGTVYTDVVVREGASNYYVQVPGDGSLMSVPKSNVGAGQVSISANSAERESLLAKWKVNRPEPAVPIQQTVSSQVEKAPDSSPLPAAISAVTRKEQAVTKALRLRGDTIDAESASTLSSGYVPYIRLRDVKLGEALRVILRSSNLDYVVEDGWIYISSPERLRREARDPVETRLYEFHGGGDTLPKIVLRGNASLTQGQLGGYSGAYGAGSYGGYNAGGASRYGQGGYGGGMGQYGTGGYGGQYGAGGYGQYGAGGYGGQNGGGYGMSVADQVSNISDLFSTIDGRRVGETPAVIGATWSGDVPR